MIRQPWFIAIALIIGVTATTGGLIVRHRMQQLPDWWAPADADSADTVAVGESTENRILTEIGKVSGRESGRPWTLELSESQANAWLGTRLPKWAASQLPNSFLQDRVSETHVRLEPGRIRIGLRIHRKSSQQMGDGDPSAGQPISVTFVPVVDSSGNFALQIDSLQAGQFPVPVAMGKSFLTRRLKLDASHELTAILEGTPAPLSVERSGGRTVHLDDIAIEDGRLTLWLRTVYQ